MGAWWGASSPSSVFKLVRKLSRVSHAAREIVTTFYVIFFIFLVTVVGQMVNPLPNGHISAGYRSRLQLRRV